MLTFEELKRGQCQWPVAQVLLPGERRGAGHRFCGAPRSTRVIGKKLSCPYCAAHAELAYTRPADRQSVLDRAKAHRKAMGIGLAIAAE